jgi:formylglycine-generating enzyme required for sulfatase activity
MRFPMLMLPDLELEVALLPITKAQFEMFLAEPNDYGDSWYEELLEVNPRTSWRDAGAESREGLWLTGVRPTEAEAFARWLGPGYDLPTVREWRAIYQHVRELSADPRELADQAERWDESARSIVKALCQQIAPRTRADLSLLAGGVFEWARLDDVAGALEEDFRRDQPEVFHWYREGVRHVGIGRPRWEFSQSVARDPLREVWAPVGTRRPRAYGFRLVRRLAVSEGAGS